MDKGLEHIIIPKFSTEKGTVFQNLQLSYQLFGQKLGAAPVVLVNHALTGNSNVAGKEGWWKELIGENKIIDTQEYTILSFNIPGNGFDEFVIKDYKSFIARDIAKLFLIGLEKLNIEKLFTLIGGSLGGGIAWEMVVLHPKITQHLIAIACDWKTTDWIIANCLIQEQILLNSKKPIHDARIHAMLCYRTPASFKQRFGRTINSNLTVFNVESWLLHHGQKLQKRFQLSAYKSMNQLLKTIDATSGSNEPYQILKTIEANICIIGINSDLFFTATENIETQKKLSKHHQNVSYHEIESIHGHDAFLIEHIQLGNIITPIFKNAKKEKNIINSLLK